MAERRQFVIAQVSDIHCGDPRFDEGLVHGCIEGVNEAAPDLVLMPGDLTAFGYEDEYQEARGLIDRIECPNIFAVPGNHDERNVGWTFFERYIGERWISVDLPFGLSHRGKVQQRLRIVGGDSAKPDLDDGELGRRRYRWVREQFADSDEAFRIFMLHHHLVGVPGTGRERNVVWDAGDVLQLLVDLKVDLVVAGHKHVPHTWEIGRMPIVTSGTATTRRTRGDTQPSYTLLAITAEHVEVAVCDSGGPGRHVEKFRRSR